MDRHLGAVSAGDHSLHRIGVFGSEVEDLSDLDTTRLQFLFARYFAVEAI